MRRWGTRAAAALLGAVVSLAVAGVAAAHVEVSADNATGGAANVTITFDAEAENDSAGIAKVQVVLPQGLAPGDVTLAKAPTGWTLTPTADGYSVGGKALAQGTNAVHSVTVAKLPNVDKLVFKLLVTYSNNDIDRWIEEPSTANPDPDNPAPVLNLKPGPTAEPTTAPPTTEPVPTISASTAAATPEPDGGSGVPAWVWTLVALVVVAGAGGGYLLLRRRSASS